MKSIFYIIVFTALLMMLMHFYQHKSKANTPVKPINTVSLQTGSTHFINNNIKNRKTAVKNSVVVDDDSEEEIDVIDKNNKEQELDYITAYRDWMYFENCYTDVEDFHNDKDPLQTLKERFAKNPREAQFEPTPQQNMYYQEHVEICKSLIEDKDDDYHQARAKLGRKFNKITPKTLKEKQLAHSLRMAKQFEKFKLEYAKAHDNKTNLPPEEIQNLNNQIAHFNDLIVEVYSGNDPLTAEHTELIKQYSAEIDQIRELIEISKQPNPERISQIGAQLDGYLNSMDDFLHKVQSPDAFLVIAEHLYKPEYYQKDSTLVAQLKQQTGIYDSYYITILNQITMPLIACSMDYPCDAQSDYMLSYCLGLRDSMFNQACGQSLENFYFNFYIGANQLNDVNNYFSYMVNRYAQ